MGVATETDPPEESPPLVVLTDSTIDPHVVVYHEPKSILAEQYRSLRTHLLALERQRSGSRALVVTSAMKGDGKSLTVANLAVCLAEAPRLRVCVVDADLRAPRIHELFGLGSGPGLTEVLGDEARFDDVLLETHVPDLAVIRAGREPRNPTELLSSDRVLDLVATLKTDFTHILFDTPPVNPYSDAAVLGARLDGALLVIRMGRTPRDQVERAKTLLERSGVRLLGAFLTEMEPRDEHEIDYYRRLEE